MKIVPPLNILFQSYSPEQKRERLLSRFLKTCNAPNALNSYTISKVDKFTTILKNTTTLRRPAVVLDTEK